MTRLTWLIRFSVFCFVCAGFAVFYGLVCADRYHDSNDYQIWRNTH